MVSYQKYTTCLHDLHINMEKTPIHRERGSLQIYFSRSKWGLRCSFMALRKSSGVPVLRILTRSPWVTLPTSAFTFVFISSATTNRSEEHTSELQSLIRISYAVICLKQINNNI